MEGEECSCLCLSVFTQLTGERVRKGKVDQTLTSTEINSKTSVIFNGKGNYLQFVLKNPLLDVVHQATFLDYLLLTDL